MFYVKLYVHSLADELQCCRIHICTLDKRTPVYSRVLIAVHIPQFCVLKQHSAAL